MQFYLHVFSVLLAHPVQFLRTCKPMPFSLFVCSFQPAFTSRLTQFGALLAQVYRRFTDSPDGAHSNSVIWPLQPFGTYCLFYIFKNTLPNKTTDLTFLHFIFGNQRYRICSYQAYVTTISYYVIVQKIRFYILHCNDSMST